MGKSIDLPDPLETSSNTPLGNADDLLAQLAGEEVDRLLAEADADGGGGADGGAHLRAEQATDPIDVTVEPQAEARPAEAPIEQQLDALFSQIATPDAAPPPPGPALPAPGMGDGTINADAVMAAVLGDVAVVAKPPAAQPPAAPVPIDPVVIAPPAALPRPPQAGSELATTPAEREALTEPNPADELPGPGEIEALAGAVEHDAPLPTYLKPLAWLNAPLDLLPQGIRDAVGQVAILTLVNAIAVLIYVFVFRKH